MSTQPIINNNPLSHSYVTVIIECCQNCDSHKPVKKHCQWKYSQHFNQLRRKIQRYVPNSIVIKNPIPDGLCKYGEATTISTKNLYIDQKSSQEVMYPRIGAFEVYAYNVLISSKLISHEWPNHYKVLEVINQCINAKRNLLPLDRFSVFNNRFQKKELFNDTMGQSKDKSIQQVNKGFRVNKSRQLRSSSSTKKKSLPINDQLPHRISVRYASRQLSSVGNIKPLPTLSQQRTQSKKQNRFRLPSLFNTVNLIKQKRNYNANSTLHQIKHTKAAFNTIQQELSLYDRQSTHGNDSLLNRSLNNHQGLNQLDHDEFNDDFIIVENKSAQCSQVTFHENIQMKDQYAKQSSKRLLQQGYDKKDCLITKNNQKQAPQYNHQQHTINT